jgi:hypothetical protein
MMANRPTSKTEYETILNLRQQLKEAQSIILKLRASQGANSATWPSEVQDLIRACERLEERENAWVKKNCINPDGSLKVTWSSDTLVQNIFAKLCRVRALRMGEK